MFEKVLPIGTIVLLKGASKRVMIIGYCKYMGDDTSKIYDYAGCLYPEGYMSPDTTALFDHEQIDVIFSLGFRNMVQHEFQQKLEIAIKRLGAENAGTGNSGTENSETESSEVENSETESSEAGSSEIKNRE